MAALIALSLASSGCLVLSLAPLYDSESMGYDARLIGSWIDQDDNASMEIGRAEWQSYRIHYVHPIETGDLTGYLTALGEDRYLDLMPGRGADRGAFLVPVHVLLRMRLEEDRLELTPLSYDWFADRLRRRQTIPGSGSGPRSEGQCADRVADGRDAHLAAGAARVGRDVRGADGLRQEGTVMLRGTRRALVKRVQPVSIHGQISLDVYFVDPDEPDGQVSLARVGPEATPPHLEGGDLVDLHYVLGAVTSVTRPVS